MYWRHIEEQSEIEETMKKIFEILKYMNRKVTEVIKINKQFKKKELLFSILLISVC